jgi:hypothetical protein
MNTRSNLDGIDLKTDSQLSSFSTGFIGLRRRSGEEDCIHHNAATSSRHETSSAKWYESDRIDF